MITKWRLFNFKSVRNDTELAFGPLTIFAGPNSSGKSTIIQSLLLLCQTLSSKVESRSVVLNGHLMRFGAFDDLKSFKSDAKQILIGCELKPQDALEEFPRRVSTFRRPMFLGRPEARIVHVSCELSFDAEPAGVGQSDILQLRPKLFACSVSSSARGEDGVDERAFVVAKRSAATPQERVRILELPDEISNQAISTLEYEIELDSNSLDLMKEEIPTNVPIGCYLRHFLPSRLTVRRDATEEHARLITDSLCGSRRLPTRFRPSRREPIPMFHKIVPLLRERLGQEYGKLFTVELEQASLFDRPEQATISFEEWMERTRQLKAEERQSIQQSLGDLAPEIYRILTEGEPKRFGIAPFRLPGQTMEAIDYLDDYFASSVRYLGPLRDEPKALYPLAASVDPRDVGLKGEHTAAVLDLHKNVRVPYIPTPQFTETAVDKTPVVRTIQTAALDWLRYMGVVEDLNTIDRGKLGHELKVTTAGVETPHDLTHVGVGVSQVLPIVVMSLLANTDTTLVFEQPELHLHPRVQTLLGDFFLSIALLGKQCIVETHSEYLINRLRFRVAAGQSEGLEANIKMYFVEKVGDGSSFRPVLVNRYGAIQDWPEGFFDQSQREAEDILKAAMLKKRQERGGRGNA